MLFILLLLLNVNVVFARTLGDNCIDRRSMQGACESFVDERDNKTKEYACVNEEGFIRCVLPKLRGEACVAYSGQRECDYGLECTGGRCFTAAGFGEPCQETAVSDIAEVCGSNLVCLGGKCTDLFGEASDQFEQQCTGDANYGFRSCRGDLTCVPNEGYCTKRSEIGEQCSSNLHCVMDARCKSFICAPLSEENDDCVFDSDCTGNLKCIGSQCRPRTFFGSNPSGPTTTVSSPSGPTSTASSPSSPSGPTISTGSSPTSPTQSIVPLLLKIFAGVVGGGALLIFLVYFCRPKRKLCLFLSHTGQDKSAEDFTGHLNGSLAKTFSHVKVFYDCVTMKDNCGADFHTFIDTSVRECTLFVWIVSPTYPLRYWCMRELVQAVVLKKPILPVFVDNRSMKDICEAEGFLDNFNSAHLEDDRVDDVTIEQWQKILKDLHSRQGLYPGNEKNKMSSLVDEVMAAVVKFEKEGQLPNASNVYGK